MKKPAASSHFFFNFFASKFTYRQRFLFLAAVYMMLAPFPVYLVFNSQNYLLKLQKQKILGNAYQVAFHDLIGLMIEQQLIRPELAEAVSNSVKHLKTASEPQPLPTLGAGFSSQSPLRMDIDSIEKAWKESTLPDLSPLSKAVDKQIREMGYGFSLFTDSTPYSHALIQLTVDKLNKGQLLAAAFFLSRNAENTAALQENVDTIKQSIENLDSPPIRRVFKEYTDASEALFNPQAKPEAMLAFLEVNKKLHSSLTSALDTDLNAQFRVQTRRFRLFLVVIFICTFAIVFFVIFRVLSTHLVQLKSQIRNIIQEQSYGESIYHHGDEFGKASEAFAWLGNTVREIVKEIQILSKRLADSIVQINGAAGDGKTLLVNQEKKIREIEETATLVGSRARELAAHTKGIISTSFQARLADETKGNLESMSHKMAFLAGESKGILNTLIMLQEKIGKMETLTSFMTRISDQGNLLALNAAIETAGAEAHRRSFSEITFNIQRFSKNTAGSAQDIEKIVKEVSGSVNKVRKEANRCLVEINQWAKELITIGAQLSGIAEQGRRQIIDIEKVSASVNEQASSAEEIISSIKQLSLDAHENNEFLALIPSVISDLDQAAEELQSLLTNIAKA